MLDPERQRHDFPCSMLSFAVVALPVDCAHTLVRRQNSAMLAWPFHPFPREGFSPLLFHHVSPLPKVEVYCGRFTPPKVSLLLFHPSQSRGCMMAVKSQQLETYGPNLPCELPLEHMFQCLVRKNENDCFTSPKVEGVSLLLFHPFLKCRRFTPSIFTSPNKWRV